MAALWTSPPAPPSAADEGGDPGEPWEILDDDGDGWSNGDEAYVYFTDPFDPSSYPGAPDPSGDMEYGTGGDGGDGGDGGSGTGGDPSDPGGDDPSGDPGNGGGDPGDGSGSGEVWLIDLDGDGLDDQFGHWIGSYFGPISPMFLPGYVAPPPIPGNFIDPRWFGWPDGTYDSDWDGLSDFFEAANFFEETVWVTESGIDEFGEPWETTLETVEWRGLRWNAADTDQDGAHDGMELLELTPLMLAGGRPRFDPLANESARDDDFDGVPTIEEYLIWGTNPLAADTDGDGIADAVELFGPNPSDPLNPASTPENPDPGAPPAGGGTGSGGEIGGTGSTGGGGGATSPNPFENGGLGSGSGGNPFADEFLPPPPTFDGWHFQVSGREIAWRSSGLDFEASLEQGTSELVLTSPGFTLMTYGGEGATYSEGEFPAAAAALAESVTEGAQSPIFPNTPGHSLGGLLLRHEGNGNLAVEATAHAGAAEGGHALVRLAVNEDAPEGAPPLRQRFLRITEKNGQVTEIIPVTLESGSEVGVQLAPPLEQNVDATVRLIQADLDTDGDNNGVIEDSDESYEELSGDQGARTPVNYDNDESRRDAQVAHWLMPDAILYDNEETLSRENWTFGRGDQVSDLAPLRLSSLTGLPTNGRVYLSVKNAEQLRAFHLFAGSDVDGEAIWGGFRTDSESGCPWVGADWIDPANPLRIDVTTFVQSVGAGDRTLYLEGLLYRGMRYREIQNENGLAAAEEVAQSPAKTFDGVVEFTMSVEVPGFDPVEVDSAKVTLVRIPAFPGAEGFGKWALGGRGGEVFVVDDLGDGPETEEGKNRAKSQLRGTLRQAIEHRNFRNNGDNHKSVIPRTVIFAVDGYIELHNHLMIKNSGFLTIAGQSAPGDGICLRHYGLRIVDNEHVIVRYLRSRPGNELFGFGSDGKTTKDVDAFSVENSHNVILDHCSATWGTDCAIDVTMGAPGNPPVPGIAIPNSGVTVQWCLMGATLAQDSVHSLGRHCKTMLLRASLGAKYSIHHNLFAHTEDRNPRADSYTDSDVDKNGFFIDFRNNVIGPVASERCLNCSDDPTYARRRFNVIGNIVRQDLDREFPRHLIDQEYDVAKAFIDDNGIFREKGNLEKPWVANEAYHLVYFSNTFPQAARSDYLLFSPVYPHLSVPTNIGDPSLYERVRDRVGVIGGNINRDAIDTEFVHDVHEMDADLPSIPNNHDFVTLKVGARLDVDSDGLDDRWEGALVDFDSSDSLVDVRSVKSIEDYDRDGMSNLEEWLNSLVPND